MTYEEALRRARKQLYIYRRKKADGQRGYDDLCDLYERYVEALMYIQRKK